MRFGRDPAQCVENLGLCHFGTTRGGGTNFLNVWRPLDVPSVSTVIWPTWLRR